VDVNEDKASARILVVDDQPDAVELTGTILEHHGFEVLRAYGGKEAIEVLDAGPVDVVLLDVSMPDVSGLDVCRHIKTDPRLSHIPVVMISAIKTEVKDIALGLDIGADEYIVKPVEHAELLARVRSMLRIKHMVDAVENEQQRCEMANQKLEAAEAAMEALNQKLVEQNRLLEEKSAHIQRELEMANEVQKSLLPSRYPQCDKLKFAVKYVPSGAVSGDFYDFVEMVDSSVGVLIADVAGHGLPAAYIGAMAKMAFDNYAFGTAHPHFLLQKLNKRLCTTLKLGSFVTMFYGIFNPTTYSFRFARAGHPKPMVIRSETGEIELLDTEGKPLGTFPDARFEDKETLLKPGDRVLFTTDGINDTVNDQGERFGRTAFAKAVEELKAASVEELLEELYTRASQFGAGQPVEDDVTLVAMEVIE
jgi:serine phosphatase RsbU (regulator of sigma subunit)